MNIKKTRAIIDEMILERDKHDVMDDPAEKLAETLLTIPVELRDVIGENISDPRKTLIIHHNNVYKYRSVNDFQRVSLLKSAIQQNSLATIKSFMTDNAKYAVSVWFSTDQRSDLDNVVRAFLNNLHRCPQNVMCPEPISRGGTIPILRDDVRVIELHVYKDWYEDRAIPYRNRGAIYARIEEVSLRNAMNRMHTDTSIESTRTKQ